jgi:thioredoxin-dependent peroxiredoxin
MLPELRAWNAEVVGVSSDGFDRQCEFARSLELSFPLIADADGAVARPYGAHRALVHLDRRVTYVIDPAGRVAAVFSHEIAIGRHEQDVRDFLARAAGATAGPGGTGAGATGAPPPSSKS